MPSPRNAARAGSLATRSKQGSFPCASARDSSDFERRRKSVLFHLPNPIPESEIGGPSGSDVDFRDVRNRSDGRSTERRMRQSRHICATSLAHERLPFGSGRRPGRCSAGLRPVGCPRGESEDDGVSRLTRLTRLAPRAEIDHQAAGHDPLDLRRQPGRDRGADRADGRSARHPDRDPADGGPERRRPAVDRVGRGGRTGGRRRGAPSGVRIPRRERPLRRGRRGGGYPLDRAAPFGDPGDGRQGRRPTAGT